MMMYTLLYMTLLTTGGWAEEMGRCKGVPDKDHTKAICDANDGGKHTTADWKPVAPAEEKKPTKDRGSVKSKSSFMAYMNHKDNNWCSAEGLAKFTSWKAYKGKGFLSRIGWGNGQYGWAKDGEKGVQQYIDAMNEAPRIGADGWKEDYEYSAVGSKSRSMKVKELLQAWRDDPRDEAKETALKADMTFFEKSEAWSAWYFTSNKDIDAGTLDNGAPVGVTIAAGAAIYALYWLPSLWYPAFLTLLGGATALYSSTNMIQMASRIQNQETELITSKEYIETIGLAGCLGCSVLVWICTQLSRTGFNFFPALLDTFTGK